MQVDPIIDRRLVWLVIRPDDLFTMHGPCCAPHQAWSVADSATLYDATTGRFLVGASF